MKLFLKKASRALIIIIIFYSIICSQSYARSLYFSDFKKINENGFGDSGNSYSWSCAWFNNKLYVGTLRHLLEMSGFINQSENSSVILPETFEDFLDLDLGAEIWEYTPSTKQWRLAYKSPTVDLEIGPPFFDPSQVHSLSLDSGYRYMLVHEGVLYITATPLGFGGLTEYGFIPRILKTTDGVNFTRMDVVFDWDVMPEPEGFISSYRSLVPFNGKFYAASAEGGVPIVFEITLEGDTATFRPASEVQFGNPENIGFFDMAVLRNYIYVGTMNPLGYEVWRTKAVGERPYQWQQVIHNGAGIGPLNPAVLSMYTFKRKLYVGAGTPSIGTYPSLIRIWPSGYWQVVCGAEVLTRQGYKKPLSGMDGGFDNIFTGYIWRMVEHDGWLYAGTYDLAGSVDPIEDSENLPPVVVNLLNRFMLQSVRENQGGFDLWKTWNGINWYKITQTGLGNPLNYGARSFASSPEGLFLCTANPYTQGDLAYDMGYEGGTEVWLGRPYFRIFLEDPPVLIPADGSDAAPAAQMETILEFAALDSYPNPANPEVWIPYQLPQTAEVSIDIHSINGQLIKTIHLGSREPGVYATKDKAAHWDGTNQLGERVASGIYFYTLEAGGFSATKKITIAK